MAGITMSVCSWIFVGAESLSPYLLLLPLTLVTLVFLTQELTTHTH
jgi:hypothetical protein